MSFLSSAFDIFVIVLGFGMLIFVHELGHFLAAKWAGIRTEAFAVGMGHAVLSWRKGVGMAIGSTHRKVVAIAGKGASDLNSDELAHHGIGETEYSLRWLPIGGFVKMLGQEDANPNAVSDDPRSYTRCSIGKRMIVVSAGVIMNLILAAVLFVIAFLAGVPMLAPVIGSVSPAMPAGQAVASNAASLGISTVGMQPGDLVTKIDGELVTTFADLQIASAMAKPGVAMEVAVERDGVDEPLRFTMTPKKDESTGLLGLGLTPGSSTQLLEEDRGGVVRDLLENAGLWEAGIRPGMTLQTIDGQIISTYEQAQAIIDAGAGEPIATAWTGPDISGIVATLDVAPRLQILALAEQTEEGVRDYESGLLGFVPLTRISSVGSANEGVLRPGDVVLSIEGIVGPRRTEIQTTVKSMKSSEIEMTLLRDGAEVTARPRVNRGGMLGVSLTYAVDLPFVARPLERVHDFESSTPEAPVSTATAADGLGVPGMARIASIAGTTVESWADIRAAILAATAADAAATIDMTFEHPTEGGEQETVQLAISAEAANDLHDLGWGIKLPAEVFEPVRVTRSAGGSPVRAIAMGIEETHKLIVMTYLTIDRLIRGSVGVEQLRGPLGIVHIGTKVLDGGFLYLIFFLAMISVNLAVINFLPIPIVDGGLFLFLVYEKFKGRPPPLAFQNAATVVGLGIIGTVLLVVTWNDVMRLIS